MHDSDLVETLVCLRPNERLRFLNFLKAADGLVQQKAFDDAAAFAAYIFECLDQHENRIEKMQVWKALASDAQFDEIKLKEWSSITVMELKDTLKTVLKKRTPSSHKDLSALISILSVEERSSILTAFSEKKMKDKEVLATLVSHYCQSFNKHEAALSETAVHQKFFGDGKNIEGKIPKFRTEALKIVRQFIALETISQEMSELEEWVLLQKFFRSRACTGQYTRIRNNILRQKSGKKDFASKDFYQLFLSESLEHELQNSRNEMTNDQNLWETIQSLDEYYLVERLWFTCQLLNIDQIAPLALPPQEAWLYFDANSPHLKWFFDKPIGKLFTTSILFLTEESKVSESDYSNFIRLLRENEHNIASKLVTSFEIFAVNLGIRRMNKGQISYGKQVFGIQQKRAGTDRIYDKGLILASEYQSIVTLGLYLGEIEWVRNFLEKNKNKVEGSMLSEKYYEFCLAIFLYKTKDLLGALNILTDAEYEDLLCKMATRILEVKVLCELELSGQTKLRIDEQLDARIEAGILFFFRLHEVPANMRIMRKRFMDFMKKIIRAKENQRWKILEKIRKEIVEIDFIGERQWLLQITDQYLARAKK